MAGGSVYVLGRGASGVAAAKLAAARGFGCVVCDDASPLPPRGGVEPEFAIVSPGLALAHPLLAECRARGIPLVSELQFGCEELKRRGWKLLAVTGSKGKSSVVKLCAEALNGIPCGNYGTPVSEVAKFEVRGSGFEVRGSNLELGTRNVELGTPRWAVVEVSSFQLETTSLAPDTFAAAAILNLQEDHLDRHGSVEAYHALKRKLLAFTRRPIAPARAAEPGLALADISARAQPASAQPASDLFRGSYFDNGVLRQNGEAAVALLRAAGLGDEKIAAAFAAFRPLPHRFELVAETGGVKFVDDSKATSLAALAAGVEMCGGPVRLVAGGLAKGDDPKTVIPVLTKRVKKVYLIGSCAELFSSVWSEAAVDCEICGTLGRAVEAARRDARSGETVLLSPGCASFDQFKSFGERGEVFAALIKEKERK